MKKLFTITMLIVVAGLFGLVQAMQSSRARDGSGLNYTVFVAKGEQERARAYGNDQWRHLQSRCHENRDINGVNRINIRNKKSSRDFFECQRDIPLQCVMRCNNKYYLPVKRQRDDDFFHKTGGIKEFRHQDILFSKCTLGCEIARQSAVIYPGSLGRGRKLRRKGLIRKAVRPKETKSEPNSLNKKSSVSK
jgi:hypothetical protein